MFKSNNKLIQIFYSDSMRSLGKKHPVLDS